MVPGVCTAHLKPILYSCVLKMMRKEEHTIQDRVATIPASTLRNTALPALARFLPGELAMVTASSAWCCGA